MANKIFVLPLKGINKGINISDTPNVYSCHMSNVRPWDILEGKLRLGQRPGLSKKYAEQIGGTVAAGIVAICQVSMVT